MFAPRGDIDGASSRMLPSPMASHPENLEVEQAKAWHAHRLESSKAVIQFALVAIRSLILVNGAAVVAVLTFLGNLWTKDSATARAAAQGIGTAITSFVVGVGLGVFTAMLAYISQAAISELAQTKPGTDPYIGTGFRMAAIVTALGSLVAFAWGAYKAVAVLSAPPLLS